jgi:hypothetical protein
VPDPGGALADEPPATLVLSPETPVITAGDWNEDEVKNGAVKGPAEWISRAAIADAPDTPDAPDAPDVPDAPGATRPGQDAVNDLGGDGPDRDGSDMALDDARDVFTGSQATVFTNTYDYVSWQDSIATLRRAFVFSSASLPADGSATPPELLGFADGPGAVTYAASDHRPVIADFILPAVGCSTAPDLGGASAGAGGFVPEFRMCGGLAAGQRARFLLQGAAPGALAVPIIGAAAVAAPFAGGTLLPSPPVALPGLLTDARGNLLVVLAGGGGPLKLVVQWAVLDPRQTSAGLCLSNALEITWPP